MNLRDDVQFNNEGYIYTASTNGNLIAMSPSNDVYTFGVQVNANDIVLEVLADCIDERLFNNEVVNGSYRAGLNITVMNVSVASATVLSTPTVLLDTNFSVPLGQTFDITQTGCN